MSNINSLKDVFTPSKVIVVACAKGGVGKSMTAVNLAVDLANQGKNVLLVDAEEEGTTIDWQDERDNTNLTIMNGFDKAFPNMIPMYRKNFDVIVIDTAGANTNIDTVATENLQGYITKKCLSNSDLILVPLDPSPVDIRKAARFFSAVESFVDAGMGNRKALMFLNKADPRETFTREAKKMLDGVLPYMPLAKTLVRDYMEFKKAEGIYQSVNEFAPRSNAALDMRQLQKEIINVLEA